MKKRIIILTTLVGLIIKVIKVIQSKRCIVFGKECGGDKTSMPMRRGGDTNKDFSKNNIIDINKEINKNK